MWGDVGRGAATSTWCSEACIGLASAVKMFSSADTPRSCAAQPARAASASAAVAPRVCASKALDAPSWRRSPMARRHSWPRSAEGTPSHLGRCGEMWGDVGEM
jgi:hypothetical protein